MVYTYAILMTLSARPMWGDSLKKRGYTGKRPRRWPFYLLGVVLLIVALMILLQTVVAHIAPPFTPDYPRQNLSELLKRPYLSDADYETLLLQTGLARPAIDELRGQGPVGDAQIISVQDSFWANHELNCLKLLTYFTMEDRMTEGNGETAYGPPPTALQNGDVLLTFSTHTFGWRHGHAGIVVDAEQGITLEAAVMGSNSQYMEVNHWRDYSNFMVLRLRDMTPELRQELTNYCIESLHDIPYHLTSGIFGEKAPAADANMFGVQCAYLVWYAYQHFGYDIDGDGGAIVTVNDLATSPLFEVVQIYGMDPREWSN